MRPVTVDVDLAAGDPEAARFVELLESVDLGALERRAASEQPTPDRYFYELPGQRAETQHRIALSGPAIPPELRPLIKALERRWLQPQGARRERGPKRG